MPFVLIIIPYLLVFKAFFLSGPLVFGDAPYFYPENLKELFQKPLSWDFRNNNFGDSQVQALWLYLPTFLMGVLGKLGITAEQSSRLVFYFPATILAILGSWLFIKKFVENRLAAILGSLLYTFNTYFLLLIDGGQIGLALSFGLFPWALYALHNFRENLNRKNFLFATLVLFALINTDLRTALTFLLLYFLLNFKELGNALKTIVLPLAVSLLLSAFWVIPFVFSGSPAQNLQFENRLPPNFVSFLNGLLLFNPHFPQNEFGRANPIPWYFVFLPLLLFGSVLFKKRKENIPFYILFIFFVFLISGPYGLLGKVYELFVNNVPFAYSFRDSTKFFIPAILIASILLAKTVENFKPRIFAIFVYFYLLLLILPALSGNLSGVLAGRALDNDYKKIYQNFKKDNNFFRSLWFPERPPLGFSSQYKEGLSASELYKEIPFALMISGTYDLFNFLHDKKLTSWFEVLGIKYAFFPQPPRQKKWADVDLKKRKLFLEFIDTLGFKKLDWGLGFPVYQVSHPRDKIYGQEKILVMIGDSRFYDQFDFTKAGVLFVEDGISSPINLLSLPKTSAIVVFQDSATLDDLKLSFLQDFFLKDNLVSGHWGRFETTQILEWRYELLKQGILNFDFGFNKGIYFSSIKDEELNFKVNNKRNGNFYLALRSLAASNSTGLKIKFEGEEHTIKNKTERFKWDIIGPVSLEKSQYSVQLKNLGGFQAVNVIALIPEEDYLKGQMQVKGLLKHFPVFNLNNEEDVKRLQEILAGFQTFKVNYYQDNPTALTITKPNREGWLIFSDHFDPNWKLEKASQSSPIYSMINGFYVEKGISSIKLEYAPQKNVDQGIILSLGTFLILFAAVIFKK